MSEANELQYSREQFPFADIFEELTDQSFSSGADPVETYLRYRRLRRDLLLTPCPDYASTSITSGGHARRPGLNTYEVINANTETARRLVAEMSAQGSLEPKAIVLPVDLGYLPHWKQSDYIHFWSLIIGGPDLGIKKNNQSSARYQRRLTKRLEKRGVDLTVMNDSSLSPESRALEYFKFAEAFVNSVDDGSKNATRVRSIVSLVDPELSLGCQTERLLAKMLGLPVRRLVPVRLIDQYDEAIADHRLKDDLDTIVRFGGTVVEAARGTMLTLKTSEVGTV